MSDQMKWFKLHFTAMTDSKLGSLDRGLRWAWAALGAFTKAHGTGGKLSLTDTPGGLAALALAMGTTPEHVHQELKKLPHITVEKSDGELTVTWKNWKKFQEDSTGADRMRALRSKRRGEENPLPTPSKLQAPPQPETMMDRKDREWAAMTEAEREAERQPFKRPPEVQAQLDRLRKLERS